MKKALLLLVSFFISSSFLFSQNVAIKSLRVYAENNQVSFPVIIQNGIGPKRITIEFDAESNFVPNLIIIFRFCDRNWIPYNNIFLLNPGKYIDYNMSYSRLPQTVKEADYHFIGEYPDEKGYVDFPFSGKWMFYITDSQDTSMVYGYGRFYVVNQEVDIKDTLKREKLENKVYFPSDLARIFNITTDFTLPGQFTPAYLDHVEIVANHVID